MRIVVDVYYVVIYVVVDVVATVAFVALDNVPHHTKGDNGCC